MTSVFDRPAADLVGSVLEAHGTSVVTGMVVPTSAAERYFTRC
ncbi:hypothetical protein [Nocardia sp. CA-119907]